MAGNIQRQIEQLVDDLMAAHGFQEQDIAAKMRISKGYFSNLLRGKTKNVWNAKRLEKLGTAIEALCVEKKGTRPLLVVSLNLDRDLIDYHNLCRKMQVVLSAGDPVAIAFRVQLDALHGLIRPELLNSRPGQAAVKKLRATGP